MPSYPSRKTKNGTVYDARFRIIDENGFEVQKRLCGYPNKRLAQQAYLEFMKSYHPPALKIAGKHGDYYFDDLYRLYNKKEESELAASSFYDLCWIFDKFITPYFAEKQLDELKKADYSFWQTELWSAKNPKTDKLYAQKYLTKIRSTLMSFLSWVEETYELPNLLKTVKKPKRKEKKKEMLIWELDEFIRFQECVTDILWKTFFMSLFYSGCRVGEILALTDNDVVSDGDGYSFVVNKGLTRKTSKAEQKYLITAPKTESSNRTVKLPSAMTNQIEEYLAFKKVNGIPESFFFGGEKPIPQRTYQRYFEKYTQDAGLKKIRIHDLRHSHASMLIHLNVPITTVSKRLGHSSVEMTLKKYAHCYSEGEFVATSAVDAAIAALKS